MPSPHSRSPLRSLFPAAPGPAPALAPSAPTGPGRTGPAPQRPPRETSGAGPPGPSRGATAHAQPRVGGSVQGHAGSCSSRPTQPKELGKAGKAGSAARLREERLPPGHSRTAAPRGRERGSFGNKIPLRGPSATQPLLHSTQEVKSKQFYSTENMKFWN